MAHISVVSPVYACKTSLIELYVRLKETLEKITLDFEIIFVNDASPDGAWETIIELAQKDIRIKGINLTRNFGQHYAITAGLDYTKGEWIIVMDCDLQDKPEEIIKLYNKAKEGFNIVFGRRINRKDNILRRSFSKLFYLLFNYFTNASFDNTISNFSIVNKKVVDVIKGLREHSRSYPLFLIWSGFDIAYINIEHNRRIHGKTSYSFNKLINFALESMMFQSNKPLKISVYFGLFLSLLSILFSLYLIIKKIYFDIPIIGWTSVMVTILFFSGLLFMNMGIIGIYIGKTLDETKKRPLYIIKEIIDKNENR